MPATVPREIPLSRAWRAPTVARWVPAGAGHARDQPSSLERSTPEPDHRRIPAHARPDRAAMHHAPAFRAALPAVDVLAVAVEEARVCRIFAAVACLHVAAR